MAENDAGVAVEEAPDSAGGEAPAAPAKKGMPTAVLLGIVIAVQVGLSFVVLSMKVAPAMKGSHGNAASSAAREEAAKLAEGKPGQIISLEPMVMNLATLEGEKPSFAKLAIAIELSVEKAPAGIDSRMPLVRDAIITTVSSRTMNDVTNPDGKEKLRQQLLASLRQVLGAELVKNVYFTNFVIQ